MLVQSYSIPNFVKIECHLHGLKNRSTFAQWRGGGNCHPTSTFPLHNFGANTGRSDLKNFFMDRYSKDELTAKNLVWNKSSSHS